MTTAAEVTQTVVGAANDGPGAYLARAVVDHDFRLQLPRNRSKNLAVNHAVTPSSHPYAWFDLDGGVTCAGGVAVKHRAGKWHPCCTTPPRCWRGRRVTHGALPTRTQPPDRGHSDEQPGRTDVTITTKTRVVQRAQRQGAEVCARRYETHCASSRRQCLAIRVVRNQGGVVSNKVHSPFRRLRATNMPNHHGIARGYALPTARKARRQSHTQLPWSGSSYPSLDVRRQPGTGTPTGDPRHTAYHVIDVPISGCVQLHDVARSGIHEVDGNLGGFGLH